MYNYTADFQHMTSDKCQFFVKMKKWCLIIKKKKNTKQNNRRKPEIRQ